MQTMAPPSSSPCIMPTAERPQILCVDDEPEVLAGLRLNLRKDYAVLLAQSGQQGLELLEQNPDIAVILSDMRMPEMDGAEFLAKARRQAPQAIRMLLTGYADTQAAIRAVNQGHLYRFLTKPCPPAELLTVMRAAAAQHRLLKTETLLLEQTLGGSIETLCETLALVLPEVYGGLGGIRRVAESLGRSLDIQPLWPLRLASMLVYTGYVSLPRDTAIRAAAGEHLGTHEQQMLRGIPELTRRLLAPIPRLEDVCSIIAGAHEPPPTTPTEPSNAHALMLEQSVGVLRISLDYHRLRVRDLSPAKILEILDEQAHRYAPEAITALREHICANGDGVVTEVKLEQLRQGMVLARGLRTTKGVLVAARDHEVTQSLLDRLRNFPEHSVVEPVHVHLPAPSSPEEQDGRV